VIVIAVLLLVALGLIELIGRPPAPSPREASPGPPPPPSPPPPSAASPPPLQRTSPE
jgi:hypothetical protein